MPSLDLASLDLARMAVLGLEGIGRGILEIFAGWGLLPVFKSVGFPLLNCDMTHYWKVLKELLSAKSLSHPELYIAEIRSQAAKLKSEIWGMSRPSLSPRGLCLMKVVILWREHIMFLTLPFETSTVPNREIELKLPSHNIGSIGWLAWYRMAKGSRLEGVVTRFMLVVCVAGSGVISLFWSGNTLLWGKAVLLSAWSTHECWLVRAGVLSSSTSIPFCTRMHLV